MSARTFDLDDPAQYQDYLEHTAIQGALYGGLYLTFNGSHVTVHDPPGGLMAVIRLEIEIPDESADELAEELHSRYVRVSALPDGWRAAMVRVLPDEEIQRERVILRALTYFLPQDRNS